MSLLVHPDPTGHKIETFGFELLAFKVVKLGQGETIQEETAGYELAIVPLGGVCAVSSPAGDFPVVGGRADVFSGLPHTLYLPIHTAFALTATTACDLAFCYTKAEESHPARLVTPADVRVEIRGGGNATRQINHMVQPSFPAHRILVCEVYTPSGNWSSYPPHKHDVHNPPGEVDLEEYYYYRIDKPEGYAIQKVYSADRRIDETLTVRDGELVLVPEGYHPVVAAHGYNAYYLNVLAGSARSMAASDDPDYAWVRDTWREQDPRLPLVR
ncbi:5-deoxy-glucuronate isomerase [uncultured Paludibaculum sp.]|uniref:5-deoxy-glucuronate isomerase n=1 Tax=uncultured Paludibaculum sp. TaxID=1765020 RepID=UPI002AAAD0F6|nr:5-deoxy-glucuronate isomerase [uncultured Paludibaculum sp.]